MKFNVQTTLIKPLNDYLSKITLFQYNARLYLVNVIISGVSMGVFRLLFNFYILSLGFNEVLMGRLITTSSLTALIVALPMGYLADVIGRKRSLLIGGLLTGLSIIGMVLWPTIFVFYALNVVMGFSQSLWSITMSPFLMENSSEKERTYLFSFGHGLHMLSGFAGNWLGGYLTTMIGSQLSISSTDSTSYGWSFALFSSPTNLLLNFLMRTLLILCSSTCSTVNNRLSNSTTSPNLGTCPRLKYIQKQHKNQ